MASQKPLSGFSVYIFLPELEWSPRFSYVHQSWHAPTNPGGPITGGRHLGQQEECGLPIDPWKLPDTWQTERLCRKRHIPSLQSSLPLLSRQSGAARGSGKCPRCQELGPLPMQMSLFSGQYLLKTAHLHLESSGWAHPKASA